MKNLKLFSTIVVIAIAFKVNGQIQVTSTGNAHISEIIHTEKMTTEGIAKGKVIIGEPISSNDAENFVTVEVLGDDDEFRTRAKMCFGDYGRYVNSGMNVFIGEYGDFYHSPSLVSGINTELPYDSDALWLHGRNGLVLTMGGKADQVIAHSYQGSKFNFEVPVYYDKSIKWGSDKRFKSEIKEIEGSLTKLKKLNGVSYIKNTDMIYTDSSSSRVLKDTASTLISNKEAKIIEEDKKRKGSKKENSQREIGLIAQELQEVYPELVSEGENGYLYVDYIGLIPIIIEALKEQQATIEAQSDKIKELEKLITASDTTTTTTTNSKYAKSTRNTNNTETKTGTKEKSDEIVEDEKDDIITNAFLFQNSPNPFNNETEIKYFIPEAATRAVVYVFNLQGTLVKTEKITAKGNGSVTIAANDLKPGMFVYSLVIDGYEVETKRMIITN